MAKVFEHFWINVKKIIQNSQPSLTVLTRKLELFLAEMTLIWAIFHEKLSTYSTLLNVQYYTLVYNISVSKISKNHHTISELYNNRIKIFIIPLVSYVGKKHDRRVKAIRGLIRSFKIRYAKYPTKGRAGLIQTTEGLLNALEHKGDGKGAREFFDKCKRDHPELSKLIDECQSLMEDLLKGKKIRMGLFKQKMIKLFNGLHKKGTVLYI